MPTAPMMLSVSEAAIIANVSPRDVNRVIDEGILPSQFYNNKRGRQIDLAACLFIAFYIGSANRLTSDERISTITRAASRVVVITGEGLEESILPLTDNFLIRDEFLTIDLSPFARRISERLSRLTAAGALVVSDPTILGGAPTIRDTRIPVYDVAASVVAGIPTERILAAYPALDAEKIDLAALYAQANPPRGRPRAKSAPPKGSTTIADRRIPRRQAAG